MLVEAKRSFLTASFWFSNQVTLEVRNEVVSKQHLVGGKKKKIENVSFSYQKVFTCYTSSLIATVFECAETVRSFGS